MDNAVLGEALAMLMFVGLVACLMLGFPVAFTLGGASLLFAGLGMLFGVFDSPLLAGLVGRTFDAMTNDVLISIPLFIFMGIVLERSKIAEDLLVTLGQSFGRFPGGLGYSVAIVGALLAASTGIVGATVVTMGLISYPAMMRAGYDQRLASGIITASGTLAQLIPPSTVLILVGTFLQNANSQVQADKGNYAATPVTVVEIFVAALLPGLVLVGIYLLWILFIAITDPKRCPPVLMDKEETRTFRVRIWKSIVPPLILIVAVLGSILSGAATATESAAVGAMGALILAALRGQVSVASLRHVCRGSLSMSTMIFTILIGAAVFSLVFRGLGGEKVAEDVLTALPGGAAGATFAVLLLMFVLGFFIDTFEIVFIVVPIFGPVLLKLGVEPIWLAVMMGMVLQTSYLTPPFGFAIFYLQGVARDLPIQAIYRGVIPFVILQLVGCAFVWFWPSIATWLPKIML
ncbi:MAG: TRAP transporter large permease subunit [Betaproteobacteria bacterium]|nr:TRAP transporter large permease subunit [Betaproteobacteria bacterium]